jgi:hypothetical protein
MSIVAILWLSGCNSLSYIQKEPLIYQHAIEQSMYATEKKKSTLLSINTENKNLIHMSINNEDYILMLTWKAKNYYPDSGAYNTNNYEIWVTAAPELYNRMQKVKSSNIHLRLKQLLGLPPTAQNKLFIELWVRPQDLFRPCPDKEVNDNSCNLCFTQQDSLDADYIKWFNQSRIDRYYSTGLYNQYPWTQLGYTYDWNPKNKSHKGVSEFVIGKNKTIYVNRVYTTEEYLKRK